MDVLESRKGLRKLNEGLGDWGGRVVRKARKPCRCVHARKPVTGVSHLVESVAQTNGPCVIWNRPPQRQFENRLWNLRSHVNAGA